MAAKQPKIYIVKDKASGDKTYVKALTKAGAISFVSEPQFEATLPTQQELVDAVKGGVQIVDATAPAPAAAAA